MQIYVQLHSYVMSEKAHHHPILLLLPDFDSLFPRICFPSSSR